MKKLKRLVSLALAGALALLLLTACGGGGNAGGAGPARTGDELVDATNQCNYAFRTELTGGKGPDYLTADANLNKLAKQIYDEQGLSNATVESSLIRIMQTQSSLLPQYGLSTASIKVFALTNCPDAESGGLELYRQLVSMYGIDIHVSSIGSYKVDNYYLVLARYTDVSN